MDFFHGLDDRRYAEFKQNVKNGWAMKSMNPLTTVKEIYRLAGVWVKPTARGETGTGATYHTEQKKTQQKEDGRTEEGKKPQKDLPKVKCYRCGKKGHMKNSPLCPKNVEKEKKHQEDGAGFMNTTWCEEIEASMYATVKVEDEDMREYVVDTAVNGTKGISLTQVLLDNQADISVMHPMMLSDVRPVERKIRVSGIGGVQLIANKVGMLDGFFQVYASEETKANVLSLADVEDKYKITYVRGQTFTVHMPEEDVVFETKSKLYVADWCVEDTVVNATVREKEKLYMKEEIHRVKVVHEFLKCSRYPSIGEATHLITDGNVLGMPMLIKDDLIMAYEVYGEHPEYVQGKMTKRTVGRMKVDISCRSVDKSLHLSTDMMHIDGDMFLILATEPLNLTLQSHIENEGKLALGMVLQGQLVVLHSRGFLPETVYTDPHNMFRSMTQDFAGVAIEVGGANDYYVAKVDAKICRIKETYRNIKLGLLWKLPKVLVKDLVAYVVSRLNIRRTMALSENVCPRVLFTGAPVDYKKELQVAFGDYVEAYEGTDNTSRARSAACIALHPVGNLSGLWILWKIETRTRVRRTNMRKMVTSDLIVQAMNATAAESAIAEEISEAGEVATQQPAETVTAEQVAEAEEGRNPESNLTERPVDDEIKVEESAEEEIVAEEVEAGVEE
jgi:hypothetical protein